MRPSSVGLKVFFPVAVSNFCGFLAGKDENLSQVRPLLEGYLNVRSLNNSCSKDVCMKTFEGAQTMEKANIKTYLFPNITVVIFSLVNAIYLVGVHPCH